MNTTTDLQKENNIKVAKITVDSCFNCPHRAINNTLHVYTPEKDTEVVACFHPDNSDRSRETTEHYDNKTSPSWCPLPDYDKSMKDVSRYGSPVPNMDGIVQEGSDEHNH